MKANGAIREDLIRLQNSINECIDDLAIARDRKDDGEELIALRRMESLLGDVKQTCTSVLNSLEEEPENNDLEKDDGVEATIVYPYSDFEFPEILPNYMELHEYLKRHNIKGGDKVIVQVRKKEN